MIFGRKKFYLSTPIYYVNDHPHIGHAYTSFAGDILSRYFRMKKYKVFFLTGTDENSQKNVSAAKERGKEIKAYLDEMSALWQETWDSLDIGFDDFIRTTEQRHRKGVEKFFQKIHQKGDIYKGVYEGLYCFKCEAFLSEIDLENGQCPVHKLKPEKIREENYFFKASKYRKKLLDYIKNHPQFIQPESRRHEIISYIKNYFQDISISRQKASWGIPLPIDKNQVFYVWFEALLNYLTGIGYGWDEKRFKKFWPADLHLIGKDIIKFHCALWPTMLFSANLPLPKRIFAHGFFTIGGEKISKSLGNTIDPVKLAQKYGLDELKYFIFKEFPFGEDGDFSEKRLKERYKGDLANGLGNTVARILALGEKHQEKIKNFKAKSEIDNLKKLWQNYQKKMEKLAFQEVLDLIWQVLKKIDIYIEENKPWELSQRDEKRLKQVLYNLLETLRQLAWMLYPLMPQTSILILEKLGLKNEFKKSFKKAQKWGTAVGKIRKGKNLFPKIFNK